MHLAVMYQGERAKHSLVARQHKEYATPKHNMVAIETTKVQQQPEPENRPDVRRGSVAVNGRTLWGKVWEEGSAVALRPAEPKP